MSDSAATADVPDGLVWMRAHRWRGWFVYVGLSICYGGVLLALAGALTGVLGSVFVWTHTGESVDLGVNLRLGGVAILLLAYVVSLVGAMCCLTAPPRRSSGWGFLLASILLQSANLVTFAMMTTIEFPVFSNATFAVASLTSMFAGAVAFIAFLHKLAAWINQKRFAKRIRRWMMRLAILLLGWTIFIAASATIRETPRGALSFHVFLMGLSSPIAYVYFVKELRERIGTVTSRKDQRPVPDAAK